MATFQSHSDLFDYYRFNPQALHWADLTKAATGLHSASKNKSGKLHGSEFDSDPFWGLKKDNTYIIFF